MVQSPDLAPPSSPIAATAAPKAAAQSASAVNAGGPSRDWGDEDRSDMTGRGVAG
jgi:hypothetical protein